MLEWLNNLRSRRNARDNDDDHGRSRRVYYFEPRGLGREFRTPYLSVYEFRSGDSWKSQRDRLRAVVNRHLLADASLVSIGSISFWRVWASIVPSVRPSHWITAGYRSSVNRWDKVPVIQFPASLGDSEGVLKDIAKPISWAIDALPIPPSLQLEERERNSFSLTLLSALSIAVRDQMTRH